MPARIIDPATGASVWALGSHRCKINIGSFTEKAVRLIENHKIDMLFGRSMCCKNINLGLALQDLHSINRISRGKDAKTVYRSIYRPAWRRSGWYPHPMMRINVGAKEASNKI